MVTNVCKYKMNAKFPDLQCANYLIIEHIYISNLADCDYFVLFVNKNTEITLSSPVQNFVSWPLNVYL